MLAEIFILRLEAMARVAALEEPQYSSGTVREQKPTETAAFTAYAAPAIAKPWHFAKAFGAVP
jgi:hypothetical protein